MSSLKKVPERTLQRCRKSLEKKNSVNHPKCLVERVPTISWQKIDHLKKSDVADVGACLCLFAEIKTFFEGDFRKVLETSLTTLLWLIEGADPKRCSEILNCFEVSFKGMIPDKVDPV